MKHVIRTIAILAGLSIPSGLAWSAPCDASTACELPVSNGTQASWTPSASAMTSIQCNNSVGPTGNVSNSKYFFAGSTTDQGASLAKGSLTTTGDGTEVIGTFSFPSGTTPASTVFGGVIQNLLGGTQSYTVYAQACPNSAAIDSALCSNWARIGTRSTLAYPAGTTVFAAPQAPADATINTINVRTGVPTADLGNVSLIRVSITDMITAANNQTLAPIGFSGNAAYSIDNTMYTQNGGFKPNVKYQYLGRVVYPYGVDVPAAGQSRGPFWTTPALPGTVSVSNITHCSAQITSQNSVGNPANPSYTVYNICATGTNGSCGTDQISGATSADTAVVTITGLNPNTSYTPNAQALVGNNDGSQTGWNSSAVKNGVAFNTLAWNGTFVVNNVDENSADVVISGLTGAGSIQSWSIRFNGVVLASGVGDPTGTHTLSGLAPNTIYSTGQIVLTETSGCSSTLVTNPATFTTTPFAPTAGTISATAPRALRANFTDGSANPNGATTTYEVQVCLNALFSSGCATTTGSKVAGAAQLINIPSGIIPETQYFARVRSRNQSRPTWPDSGWFDLGNVTTPNEAPSITSLSCPNPSGGATTTTCAAQATDNAALNLMVCHYAINNGGSLTSANDQLTNASGVCPAMGISMPTNGSYTVTLTITDHSGTVPPGLTDVQTANVNVGQTPTTITITGGSTPVGRGQTSAAFTATVRDQFNAVITGQAVNWTVTGAGNSMSPGNGTTSSFNAGNVNGPYTITAAVGSATPGTAPVTVQSNTVTVTPNTANAVTGGTVQFTAVVRNPANVIISPAPTVNWSATGGTINASGLYSATAPGPFTITATDVYGDVGTASVTNSAAGPIFTTAPSLVVNSDGIHGTASARATDNVTGTGSVIYTWTLVSGPGTVGFSANGTNAAQNSVVTFSKAGTYVLSCAITSSGISQSQSAPSEDVPQLMQDLDVCVGGNCPNSITVRALQDVQFIARGKDQFGDTMTAPGVTWDVNGTGSINGAGVYNSTSLGRQITVTAHSGSFSSVILVSVVSYDVSGAHPYPVPFKASEGSSICFTGMGSDAKLRIYTISGRKVFETQVTPATPGGCEYSWDVKNSSGESVASGVYFYVIESPETKKNGKLVIIK